MGALPVLEKCRLDLLSNPSSCRRPTSYTYTSSPPRASCKYLLFSSPSSSSYSPSSAIHSSFSHSPLSLSPTTKFLPNRHHPFLAKRKGGKEEEESVYLNQSGHPTTRTQQHQTKAKLCRLFPQRTRAGAIGTLWKKEDLGTFWRVR